MIHIRFNMRKQHLQQGPSISSDKRSGLRLRQQLQLRLRLRKILHRKEVCHRRRSLHEQSPGHPRPHDHRLRLRKVRHRKDKVRRLSGSRLASQEDKQQEEPGDPLQQCVEQPVQLQEVHEEAEPQQGALLAPQQGAMDFLTVEEQGRAEGCGWCEVLSTMRSKVTLFILEMRRLSSRVTST